MLVALAATGQTGAISGPRSDAILPSCRDRQAIESYTRSLDAKLKALRQRKFGKAFSDESQWMEVSGDHAGDSALIFTQGGKPVVTTFTFSSESGDWILDATYYFRSDGTLAKRHELLNTFYGHASVTRDSFYSCTGEPLFKESRHADLKTKKEKPPEQDFIDEDSPVFKRVEELPFWKLLSTQNK